jgi:uncharacterized membrane protein YfcA
MNTEETKNRVIVMVTITLCVFLLISLVGAYLLAWNGKETGDVWPKVFDLVSVLTGALVGYIAGSQFERSRAVKELSPKRYVDLPPDSDERGDD